MRPLQAKIAASFLARSTLAVSLAFAINSHATAGQTAPTNLTAPLNSPAATDCQGIRDLAFVAHMDDDLLFMNPDLQETVRAGGCLAVVYLTASERDEGVPYMLSRERAVRAAHAYMAEQPDAWQEDRVIVGGHTLARQRLLSTPRIQLLHMRLQDPWLGKGWGSLTPLSRMELETGQSVSTLGEGQETYDRAELVTTLARIIQAYQPTTVRHLDDTSTIPYTSLCWRCAGHGHPDHIASARFVREAMLQAPGVYTAVGYVDYPTQDRAANLNQLEINEKTAAFLRYAWLDRRYCAKGTDCQQPFGPTAAWVSRSYYLSRHDSAPAMAADRDQLLLAATDEWNNQISTWQAGSAGWLAVGGRSAEAPVAFNWPDGAAGLMLRDALGIVSTNRRATTGEWLGWQTIDGTRIAQEPHFATTGGPAVALGNDGLLYLSQPGVAPDWRWQPWQALPRLPGASNDTALLQDENGRLHIFALDTTGRIFETIQTGTTLAQWQAWEPVPAPSSNGGLAAVAHAGAQSLYLRGLDGDLHRLIRQAGQPGWQTATDLDLDYVGQPAVGLGPDGDVVVATLEHPGGPIWVLEDGKAPIKLTDAAASVPVLRQWQDSLYIAARGVGTNQVYALWKQAAGSDAWARTELASLAPSAPLATAAAGNAHPAPAGSMLPSHPTASVGNPGLQSDAH